jgi:hypothetical protein
MARNLAPKSVGSPSCNERSSQRIISSFDKSLQSFPAFSIESKKSQKFFGKTTGIFRAIDVSY